MRIIPIRLLPVTIAMAFLMLAVKVADLIQGGTHYSEMLIASQSYAVQEPDAATAIADPAAKPDASAKTDAATPPPTTPAATDGKDAAKPTEQASVAPEKAGASAPQEAEKKTEKKEFTQIELDLLQNLSKRREELDSWGKEIEMREGLLKATEVKLNEKIGELKGLKQEVETLLTQYNEKEDVKIRSLVKIYENMKPKDAARIFDEVDMPILLQVIDRMSERKVAPILANMNPQRAKDLTVELAEQKKLPKTVE